MTPPSRHVILSMFLLLCCQHAWSNDDRCVPGELAVATHTCNFWYNFCAWGNNYNNDFNWTRVSGYDYFYWSAWIYQKNAYEMARLESRPICSSVNNKYFLEFDYMITMERNNICQLSVDLLVDNIAPTNLLRRQNHTGVFVHFNRNIIFNDRFQIVFKAISLGNVRKKCWIFIENVRLTHETVTTPTASAQRPTSMTTSTPHPDTSQTSAAPAAQTSQSATILSSPPPSTAPITASTFVKTSTSAPPETSVTSSDTAGQNLQTDAQSQAGPSAGAVIGIVIGAVLAVIVVVCTGVILLARRKASGSHVRLPWIFKNLFKHSSTAEPRNGVFAVANSAYVSGDECTPVHEHPTKEPSVHTGMKVKRGDTIEYELAAVIGSDGGYCTPDDVDLKAGRREQQNTGRTDVDGSKGSDYNKLFLQTPSSAAVKNTEDTYNHLQDQDNVYNVPRGEDSEYALAGNPDKPDTQLPANAAQNQHYVNVDERGKPVPAVEANTDYNHLNIKTDHASVTERRNPPSDVYNHLDEAVQAQPSQQADDEYNRVDFNGRPRVTGEAGDDATYNHLDTPQG